MSVNTIDGDLFVTGTIKAVGLYVPNSAIGNAQVNILSPILIEKTEKRYVQITGQKHTETANAERRVIHTGIAAGAIESFKICASVANIGDSTVTVDLLKNGSTILSSVPSLTSANAAYIFVLGVPTSLPYAAGDVFEVNITISAGTGTLAKGVNGVLAVREGA